MLPTEPPRRGRIRAALEYFGLATPTGPPRAEPEQTSGSGEPGRARPLLVYFGLADDPNRSRYGAEVRNELDQDVDALRARVAELEARLSALENPR